MTMSVSMPVLRALALKRRSVGRALVRCCRTHERHGELVDKVHRVRAREGVRERKGGEICAASIPVFATGRSVSIGVIDAVLGMMGGLREEEIKRARGSW